MRKRLTWLIASALLLLWSVGQSGATTFFAVYTPAASGSVTASCTQTRTSGAPPLAVFFDCTGTTSSYVASGKEFVQIYGIFSFGDTGSSGTGNWSYGADGWGKAKNSASGLIGAHLYADAGTYSPTFVAYVIDTATGTLYTSSTHNFTSVTVSNPDTAYPTTATICVSSSGTFTNCTFTGAQQITQSDYTVALSTYLSNNTRVLFRCGDTFTGNAGSVSGSGWRIGAYGTCVGTTTGRPIWQQTGSSDALDIADTVSDVAISDIYVDGSTFEPGGIIANESTTNPLQLTIYNVALHAMGSNFWTYGARQYALVASTADSMSSAGTYVGSFVNADEWNGAYSYDYSALIGNSLDGAGGGGAGGQEVLRISACNLCVFSNNDVKNANTLGAVFKFHAGNTNNSCNTWAGYYSQNTEISDNHFSGTSGANLVEVAPQNGAAPGTYACGAEAGYMDERLRRIVIERNFFESPNTGGRELTLSGQDMAVRNNVFSIAANDWGIQLMQRSNISAWPSINNEVYNNTCYSASAHTTQACVEIGNTGGSGTTAPASNTIKNTLANMTSTGAVTVDNAGGGANTISNNTTTPGTSPGFVNGSTTFSLYSDFKPTTAYTGAATVQVPYDGLGVQNATWDLGAVKH